MIPMALPQPPACMCCAALAGSDHRPDCNYLAAMRAQEYPTILDLKGLPYWWGGSIAGRRAG
jgi:hypothetical protein